MFATFFATLAVSTLGAGPDVKATAQTLVNQCASVKTGDRVLISGRQADMELLEQVAIDVRKLGAFPLITVSDDQLARRMYEATPAQFDAQPNGLMLGLAGVVNATISVEAVENPTNFADVPAARMASLDQARRATESAMLKSNVRAVTLGNGLFPTPAMAKMYGVSLDQLSTIFWSGVNTDYAKLQATGQTLASRMMVGKEVHITNKNGTDLRIGIASRQAFVSDGVISSEDLAKGGAACQVWLPAGEVFSTPVPGAAEGTVVVDRTSFRGREISGLTLVVRGGKVVSMTAKSGLDALKAAFDAGDAGKDELSFIDIGINSDVAIPEGSKMLTWVPAGMVTIGIGNNNWAGGKNNSGFSASFFMPGSTLTIDGVAVVENGKLSR